VLPADSDAESGFSSCGSSDSGRGGRGRELYDQLTTSPETRFHAAYMLVRYFYLTMGESERGRGGGAVESDDGDRLGFGQEEGWDLVTWDVAVGCLALSVKVSSASLLYPTRSLMWAMIVPPRCAGTPQPGVRPRIPELGAP
jgi:hypothetical protein